MRAPIRAAPRHLPPTRGAGGVGSELSPAAAAAAHPQGRAGPDSGAPPLRPQPRRASRSAPPPPRARQHSPLAPPTRGARARSA